MSQTSSSARRLYDVSSRQRYILFEEKQYLNFSSNDYLSLSDVELQSQFIEKSKPFSSFVLSNASSRLMTGNTHCYKVLEDALAALFEKESALVLSSGFMVNCGVLPALVQKRDLIIADKLVHASIVDGLRQCSCDFERFGHNDMAALRRLLERKRGDYDKVYLVVESIYSMDGDLAPMLDIIELKREFDVVLYVDEAHAFGVRGARGAGLCSELGLLDEVDIVIVTLGKALASQGGVVISTAEVRERLINTMRTLIFSTALPDISLQWSHFLVERVQAMMGEREQLMVLARRLYDNICDSITLERPSSHIVPIIMRSNEAVCRAQMLLRERGYWVTAIRHPTVPKGSERLRISLCCGITNEQIDAFSEALKEVYVSVMANN